MQIAILMSIARQVEGELIQVKVIKACGDPKQLFQYLQDNQLPRTAQIDGVGYVIEYGVIDQIEVE